MAEGTKIEWTHRPGTIPATMNALVGCRKVSEGCRNCYAIEVAHIRAGNPLPVMQEKFAGTTRSEGGKRVWTGKVTLSEKALLDPLRRKAPRTYFVNALSDLFYEGVPDEWIDRHFAVFALCPQHTFIVLTKRPERMRAYLSVRQTKIRTKAGNLAFDLHSLPQFSRFPFPANAPVVYDLGAEGDKCGCRVDMSWPLPNVWLGVSVEDQKAADERIPLLLQTPAAVRFISAEPLLGPISFAALPQPKTPEGFSRVHATHQFSRREAMIDSTAHSDYLPGLDWVICGGESGPGARPMHPDWARSLRGQCVASGVPFFFKQWGEWIPVETETVLEAPIPVRMVREYDRLVALDGTSGLISGRNLNCEVEGLELSGTPMRRVGKKAAGHLLDGVEWHQFPGVPHEG